MKRGSAIRSQAILLGSFVARIALGLAVTAVLGGELEEEAFGFFALVGTVFFVGHEIMNLGMISVCVREIVRDPSRERPLLEGLIAWRRVCGVGLAVALLVWAIVEQDPLRRSVLVGSAVGMTLLSPWALYAVFQTRQAQGPPVAIGLLGQLLTLVGGAALLALRVAGPLFAWLHVAREVLGAVLLRRIAVRMLGYRPTPGLRGRGLGPFLRVAAVYALATLGHSVYVYVDVFIVRLLRGEAELGAYAAAFRPMTALMAIPGTLMIPILPLLSSAAHEDRARYDLKVRGLTSLFVGLGLISAVACALLARDGVELLYRGRYLSGELDAVPALRWLGLGFGAMFAASAFPTAMLADHRERTLLALVLLGLVANIVGNLVFVPHFGFTAAAATTAGTEVLFGVSALFAVAARMRSRSVSPVALLVLAPGAAFAAILWLVELPPLAHIAVGALLAAAAGVAVLRAPSARAVLAELKKKQTAPGEQA